MRIGAMGGRGGFGSAGAIGGATGPRSPSNTAAPALSSTTATSGTALTCTQGTWTGADSYAYQWYWAITSGGIPQQDGSGNYLGTAISGATSSSYTPVNADIDQLLFCDVTATNAQGSTVKSSDYTTATVAKAEPQQFLSRVSVATSYKIRYADMIDAVVTADAWSKIASWKLYKAPDAATSLINLKSSSYPTDNTDALSFTADAGYTGLATKALKEPRPTEMTQTSSALFGWTTLTGNSNQAFIRGNSGPIDSIYVFTDNHLYVDINSTVDDPSGIAITTAAGMYGGSRTNDTITYYQNGANKGTRSDTAHAVQSGVYRVIDNNFPGTGWGFLAATALSDAEVAAINTAMANF